MSRDETGIRISNMWTAQQMLTSLGYVKIFEMEKYRTEYRIGDVNFDIDEYPGMTPILEIESSCRKKVDKYIKMLGLDIRKVGRIYIREILQAKKNYDEKKKKEYKHFEE